LSLYKSLIRRILFKIDAEAAHRGTIRLLEIMQNAGLHRVAGAILNPYEDRRLETQLFGAAFRNPVGLAAGFDKDGRLVSILPFLGFGFIEIGTVTGQSQTGNPRPRLFRLAQDHALINRMGFNSQGATTVANRLSRLGKPKIPVGINIGKTEAVDVGDAAADYLLSFEKLYPYGDYFVVNVSCPNTPGLQELQIGDHLEKLLSALNEAKQQLRHNGLASKPILVKISPDLSPSETDGVLGICKKAEVGGIIATNTTATRKNLKCGIAEEWGGLSGKPLKTMSTEVVKHVYRKSGGCLPIIAAGGVFTAADAYEKIKAGASLVQVYTGMVYEGPAIVRSICRGLASLLEKDGYSSISQAVGDSA
jgi:dihydroorotate dehydrogenase